MSRKSFSLLFAGLVLGAALNSGFFNEAEQVQMSKAAWTASISR